MVKKTSFINEMLKELKDTSKYLKEAYVFDDEPDMMGHDGKGAYGEGGYEEDRYEEPHREMHHEEGESAEEQAMHAQEIIKHEPIISKIRETAIDGLRKYADNPTSEIYEYFKDVFLSSDKLLTGKGK